MENRNNDEFELNFDDDVVDMTDSNYRQSTDTYGSYNDTQYNNTNYQRNDDIYGVYQPGRSYDSKAEAEAARREAGLQKNKTLESIVNVLYYIALWSSVGYMAYFWITKNYDVNLFISISRFLGIFVEAVIIVDACLMNSRYKKASLLITGILFPFLYPFFRNSARGESKSLSALWVLASIVVAVLFVKDTAIPMVLSTKGIDLYESKYETTMKKFKDYEYDGKTKTERVIQIWFQDYKLNVKNEDTENIYVELSGQTDTEIQGIVKSDKNIKPNTECKFKVKKSDGSYDIQELRINDKLYNIYKDGLWEYWYSNYEKALPW